MIDVAWLEAAGLSLVLLSSFIKLFLSDPVSDIHRGVLQIRQEEKIDSIWMLLTSLSGHLNPLSTKKGRGFNLDGVDESWQFASASTYAGKQATAFKSAETYMFLLGSILLVGAKAFPLMWPKTFHEHSPAVQQQTPSVSLIERRLPLFKPASAMEPHDALVKGVCEVRSTLQASGSSIGFVVGHHDRQPLSKAAASRFSSNMGLAQQRADTVGGLLLDARLCSPGAPPLTEVIAVTGGPRLTDMSAGGKGTKIQSFIEDRSVEIIGVQYIANVKSAR
jgi:hypothetical protein